MKKFTVCFSTLWACILLASFLICGCSPKENYVTRLVTNSPATLSSIEGIIEEEPIPKKTGHSFEGWFADETFSGDRVTFPYVPQQNGTLYAKWTLIDTKAIVIELFQNRYADPNTETWEKVTFSDGIYTHTRKVAFDGSEFQFKYNTKSDMFTINGYFALKLSSAYTAMCATNLTFRWGSLNAGISVLNEVSYLKNGSRIHTNLYSLIVLSHNNTSATLTFVADSNNDYSTLKNLYHINSDEKTEKLMIQDTFNRAIEYANDFIYETQIKF